MVEDGVCLSMPALETGCCAGAGCASGIDAGVLDGRGLLFNDILRMASATDGCTPVVALVWGRSGSVVSS